MTAVNRRRFILSGTAASTGFYVSTSLAHPSSSLLDKLNIACIGTANRAAADIKGVLSQNIVGLCDVDQGYLYRSVKSIKEIQGREPASFVDYREMIDLMGDRIDAVVVATADHHHAPATLLALRAGKHVYCEKPLTHSVEEARLVAEASVQANVATQMGTQIHAGENYRRVVEIIRSGTIGEVTDVHVWVGKGWGGGDRPSSVDPVPDNLSWDLWLGPAPVRPFAAGRYHPANWRRWWDFGQGTLGDMACHYMDLPFWALCLRHPTSCHAEGPSVHPDTCPTGLRVAYRFPVPSGKSDISLTWYDGNLIPKEINGQRVPGSGVMFVGSDGMMFASYTNYRLFPTDKFAGVNPPPRSIPPSVGHHEEWIEACLNGTPTTCNFIYSGALTEAVLLGNVAYRTGRKLEWNAEQLRATNTDAADKFISKQYREGWKVDRKRTLQES